MEAFLGIDLGTSCVKVALITEAGQILGLGSSDISVMFPKPGYVEQRPIEWWQGTKTAIENVQKKCPNTMIKGIGISGQMLGSVLLDDNNQVIDNCIIWMDQRSGEETDEIINKLGRQYILDHTANDPLVSYWAPKLCWLKKHKPDIYDRIAHVLFPKDYLKFKLTGEYNIDVTDATGTMLFSTEKRDWDWDMFDKLDIPRSIVPKHVSESFEIIGKVSKEAADYLNIQEGIPVVAGGGDQMCGAIGLGVVSKGKIASTIGTSGCIFSYSDTCIIDSQQHAILSYCHSVPNTWSVYGCTLTAGGAFQWLKNSVFSNNKQCSYDDMTRWAGNAVPGSEGLIFLPYLNGERTPHPNPDARGVFFGLSTRHGKEEICRSVMEGVTYSLNDTVEILRNKGVTINQVIAAGGGASSRLWCQIQADIFQAEVVTTNVKEAPATGAAMIAAVGLHSYSSFEEAAKAIIKVECITAPNKSLKELYSDYYQIYKQLYDRLEPLYKAQAHNVRKWQDYE